MSGHIGSRSSGPRQCRSGRTVLAGRVESTAEKLNAASVRYAVNDEDSAAQLGAVSIEV